MGNKTPAWPVYKAWTEARWWAFLRSGFRALHQKWPPSQEFMKKNRKAVEGKRHKFEHQCAVCLTWVPQKDVERDHIVPCGPLRRYEDIPPFVQKLFAGEDGYQKLCKNCHMSKTKTEREEAKRFQTSRIDIIGQNGNTGEHYPENEESRK